MMPCTRMCTSIRGIRPLHDRKQGIAGPMTSGAFQHVLKALLIVRLVGRVDAVHVLNRVAEHPARPATRFRYSSCFSLNGSRNTTAWYDARRRARDAPAKSVHWKTDDSDALQSNLPRVRLPSPSQGYFPRMAFVP